MKRPNEIQVDPDAPWANDDLQRKDQGETLSRLIKSVGSNSYVISVRAPWGAGKSTFLRRLAATLEKQGVPTITLNAWQYDFMEDPLLSYLGAIRDRLKQAKHPDQDAISSIADLGSKLCGPLLGGLAKILLPGGQVIAEVADAVTKGASFLLEQQDQHQKNVRGFRERLDRTRDLLTGRTKDEAIRPIAFIVDELDRCRPEFAVKALERIKHFFDIPGLAFVIATDGDNLPAAVATVYGAHQNAERYLRKFIDFEFRLRDPTPEQFLSYLLLEFGLSELTGGTPLDELRKQKEQQTTEYLGSAHELKYQVLEIANTFPSFARATRLSLRDQTQAFAMISAVLRAAPADFIVLPTALVACVVLRFASPLAYERLHSGSWKLTVFAHGSDAIWKVVGEDNGFRNLVGSPPYNTYFSALANVLNDNQVADRRTYFDGLLRQSRTGDPHFRQTVLSLSLQIEKMAGRRSLADYERRLLTLAESFAPRETT